MTPGALGADGLSRFSRDTAKALAGFSLSIPVELWSLMDDGEERSPAPAIKFRGASGSRVRYTTWILRQASHAQRERLVIALHTHLAPLTLPLVWRGARFVHVLVGIESWKPLSKLQRSALARADLLLAISSHSALEFKRANPAFAGRELVVCHPGIEPLGVEENDFRDEGFALIVGRMARAERYKGHDLLLELWPELRRRCPDARLLVVGDGDDRPRLEEKSRGLGLDGAVRFLGRTPDVELDALYRDCAFFLMPSRNEGFGLVFLEAMRAGKPSIGAFGAASEIIEDGVTGFLVRPDDREQQIRVTTKMFREPELRHEMGRRAKERFLADFTSDAFQARLKHALGRLGQCANGALDPRR